MSEKTIQVTCRHGGDGGVALRHRRGRPLALRVLHAREKTDQVPNLIIRKRRLDPKGVAIVSGIPATRSWLTVVDLIDSGEDLSLVANALADALERGLVEDEGALRQSVDARAAKAGMPAEASLYDALARRRGE